MEKDINEVVNTQYFTPENSSFYRTLNGFPAMKAFLPPKRDDLEEAEPQQPVWQDLGRVWFHRAFPFDAPEEYISVLDRDGIELGIIRNLSDFAESNETVELIRLELHRKYLAPVITKIISLKDKLGYSYWVVETDSGKRSFTMQDTFRNLFHNSENGIILTDTDGNRYSIPNVLQLDPKSYRKIELFL